MSNQRRLELLGAVPRRPVLLLATCGLLLLAVASVWVSHPVATFAVTLGLASLAAAVAYLLDEAAAEAADATPTTLRRRTATRATAAVALLAVGVLGLALLALRTGSGTSLAVAVQVAGCSVLALAAAALLRRRMPEPGEVVGGCTVALVVGLALVRPFDRWVDLFPRAEGDRWAGSTVTWGVIVVASVLVLAYASRDPFEPGAGSRSPRLRAGR